MTRLRCLVTAILSLAVLTVASAQVPKEKDKEKAVPLPKPGQKFTPKQMDEAVAKLVQANCSVHYEEPADALKGMPKWLVKRRQAAKFAVAQRNAAQGKSQQVDIVAFPDTTTDADLVRLIPFAMRLPNLRTIDLGRCRAVTAVGLKEVARLQEMKVLLLDGVGTDREGMRALGDCRDLQYLDLSNSAIDDRALALIPQLTNLNTLILKNCNQVTAEGLTNLEKLNRLRVLHITVSQDPSGLMEAVGKLEFITELKAYPITDAETAHIAKLSRLQVLDVGHYPFADYDSYQWWYWRGWQDRQVQMEPARERMREQEKLAEERMKKAGAKVPAIAPRRVVGSYVHEITGKGLANIAKCTNLRSLDVSGHPVDVAGSSLESLEFLQELDLTGTRFSNDGGAWLGKLKALKTLRVGATRLTTDGIRELAAAGGLEVLSLDLLPIGDEALSYLMRNRKLRELSVNGTRVALADRRALYGLVRLEWFEVQDTNVTDANLMNLASLKTLYWVDARLNCPNVTQPGCANLRSALGPDAMVVSDPCEGYWPGGGGVPVVRAPIQTRTPEIPTRPMVPTKTAPPVVVKPVIAPPAIRPVTVGGTGKD